MVKKQSTSSISHQPSLDLNNVSFSWPNGIQALNECTFSIPHPGLWMLVGSNGSGKSTLFKLIKGMIKPITGQISCSFRTSLMFQNPDHQLLLPTCASDLVLGLPRNLNIEERLNCINKALCQVGMGGMEDRPVHTLSGGQKQRLALAGALASGSELLLLDEPTALLDPSSQRAVLEIVQKLCNSSENPKTALWITHRLEELHFCNGAAIMERGTVSQWFSGQELILRLKPLAGR